MSLKAVGMKHFRWPQFSLARFVIRRSLKGMLVWAIIFGGFTIINTVGFKAAYASEAAREQLANSFGSNFGLQMLLGEPFRIHTVAGFNDWRVLGTVTLIGSVWALLYVTKVFRGEEAAGRQELFLAGQTTARKAAAQALAGLSVNLLAMFLVVTALVAGLARAQEPSLSFAGCLSFSLAVVMIVALFMAVGAIASQIVPTRTQAASSAAAVFGVFFLARGIGATSENLAWFSYLTPLGWLERVHPLTLNHAQWFLPVFALILFLGASTVYMAGKRDMGSSLVADKDTAKPHLRLLGRPFTIAVRLTRSATAAWLAGISFVALLLGSLAKSAGEALAASNTAAQFIDRLSSNAQLEGALAYLGIAFFMVMTLMMLYTASAVSAVRTDEAEGYVDNLLVRPVSRVTWLGGRVLLIVAGIGFAGMLAGVAAWLGAASQGSGMAYDQLLTAGINAMAPALFVLGVGIAAFGIAPRLTSAVAYGVVAWSFAVQMIGSALDLSPWVLNLSVLHHIAFAPATDPNWTTALILMGIGLLGCLGGVARFTARDLKSE